MNTQINYHYYGKTIRNLFVAAGLIMLVTYPFFYYFINEPILFSVIACVGLVVLGGLINPTQKRMMIVNAVIAMLGFVVFEYATVYTYLFFSPEFGTHVSFFLVNQILSLLFFFAAYFSVKTARGSLVKEISL